MSRFEPASCPTLTRGEYTFDYGDTARMAPVVKMHTLGHDFVPPAIHAGGLRYHGMAPQISALVDSGHIEPHAIPQLETFRAGVTFAKAEGVIPAPEATHAVAGAIREALAAKERGEETVICFNLCGHGHFDMAAYDAYFKGELNDHEYPQAAIDEAMKHVPQVG